MVAEINRGPKFCLMLL